MTERPTWEPLDLVCRSCGWKWTDYQPSGVRIPVAVAVIELIQCPECHTDASDIVVQQQAEQGFKP